MSLFGGHHSILPDRADIEGNYDRRERRSLWEFLGGNVQRASKSIAFEGAIASVLQIQKEAQIWVSCMVVKKKKTIYRPYDCLHFLKEVSSKIVT